MAKSPLLTVLRCLLLLSAMIVSNGPRSAQAENPVGPMPDPISATGDRFGPSHPIPLWSGRPPGAIGNGPEDKPRLYVFLPARPSSQTSVLLLPGGGYSAVALGREGFQVARWLNAQGVAAFVLDYRVAPYRYPVPIDDGRRAMRLIRARALDFGIDPHRLGAWGFSAGGHLAASLATGCGKVNHQEPQDNIDRLSCRPDFLILAYALTSMDWPGVNRNSLADLFGPRPDPELVHRSTTQFAVSADTPPTFLFATTRDPRVRVENSVDFYRALAEAGVSAELHLFDYANHGCGLCGGIPALASWTSLLRAWLIRRSLMPASAPLVPVPAFNYPLWPAGFDGPGRRGW